MNNPTPRHRPRDTPQRTVSPQEHAEHSLHLLIKHLTAALAEVPATGEQRAQLTEDIADARRKHRAVINQSPSTARTWDRNATHRATQLRQAYPAIAAKLSKKPAANPGQSGRPAPRKAEPKDVLRHLLTTRLDHLGVLKAKAKARAKAQAKKPAHQHNQPQQPQQSQDFDELGEQYNLVKNWLNTIDTMGPRKIQTLIHDNRHWTTR